MSSSNPIGSPFIELLSVESTNNYAMGLVHEGMAQHGTAVFTHEQTRGKGQRNKAWDSQKDQNIALSVILEPSSVVSSGLFVLSMAVAVATRHFFSRHAMDEVTIKWPNDIYWRDRKAAGILIENLWQGSEWRFAIAGIGVNINQTDFGVLGTRAVSLKQITGKSFEPLTLAMELCSEMEAQWQVLKQDGASIAANYRQHLYRLHETVRFKKDNRIFEGTVEDVTLNGQLVVQHAFEESFSVGEVEWMIG